MNPAQKVEQLEQKLAANKEITEEDLHAGIDELNALAWSLCDTDMDRAYDLAEQAHKLSTAGAAGAAGTEKPYATGMAYSLRTQGYVNQRLGSHTQGMVQLFEALALLESLQPTGAADDKPHLHNELDDCRADVYDGIAGIHFQCGSFPEALEMAYTQLEVAQRLGDRQRVLNAQNNLAAIHFETGEIERNRELLHANLRLSHQIGHTRIECITSLNLAEAYTFIHEFDQALTHAQKALRLSNENEYALFEVYAHHMIGQCYLEMNRGPEAIAQLQQALTLSRTVESKTTDALVLLTLGKAYRAHQQMQQAKDALVESIAIAQSIHGNREVYQGHQLLAEIYESEGDMAQALEHFRTYHTVKERVTNEQADQRLQVLQVAHDTETAQREAKLLQLRTTALQQEVSERKEMESQLQRQIAFLRVLSAFKQTLMVPVQSQDEQPGLLTEALRHLLPATGARTIMLHRNVDDAELGLCARTFALVVNRSNEPTTGPTTEPTTEHATENASIPSEVRAEFSRFLIEQLPSLAARPEKFLASTLPWSVVPQELAEKLADGQWVGGPIAEVYTFAPQLREYLLHVRNLHSVLIFPIHIDGHWWGVLSMTEWGSNPAGAPDDWNQSAWHEDQILMLGTVVEMISSTIQRWQAETNLYALNEQLEQQVARRTAELTDTVEQLRIEIQERQRADREIQNLTSSLEQRLADRTEELAAFFDLTILGTRAANIFDVAEYALPRMLEITHSRAICVHTVDADGRQLQLAAQQNLLNAAEEQLHAVDLPDEMRRWMQEPNVPLVTTDLHTSETLPRVFQLPDFRTYLGAQIKSAGRVEGLLSCFRYSNRGFSLDEIALATALAEQIGLVIETARLRQNAEEMAVLEERQRLARDLHDSVTQSLYSLSLFSRSGLEAVADGDTERLTSSLTMLERNTLQALREMRLLLYELRPADLAQEGLARAIELRLNTVEQRVGLQLNVQMDDLPELDFRRETELYHIVVEALNNVVKHASATRLSLQLTHANGHIHLHIVDNGSGFDPAKVCHGLGLRNMQERAAWLHGQLSIVSEPSNGTWLEVTVPFNGELDRPGLSYPKMST